MTVTVTRASDSAEREQLAAFMAEPPQTRLSSHPMITTRINAVVLPHGGRLKREGGTSAKRKG
jgi:hypothetical protein